MIKKRDWVHYPTVWNIETDDASETFFGKETPGKLYFHLNLFSCIIIPINKLFHSYSKTDKQCLVTEQGCHLYYLNGFVSYD